MDGFVWGAMVGIGFLVVEDIFYFMNAYVSADGNMEGVWGIAMIRILGAGPYSHFLYTGLTGMGIAYYVTQVAQPKSKRLGIGLLLAAFGVGAHFIWNSPLFTEILSEQSISSFFVFVTVKGLPLLVGLVIVVMLARARDKRWFGYLASNPAIAGDISGGDMAELGGLVARWRGRRAAGARKGAQGKRLRGLIQRQMVAMAITASHAPSPDDPQLLAQRETLRQLRAQFEALPEGGAAAAPAGGGWAGQPGGASGAFAPTHTVPADGLQAWASPDPRTAAGPAPARASGHGGGAGRRLGTGRCRQRLERLGGRAPAPVTALRERAGDIGRSRARCQSRAWRVRVDRLVTRPKWAVPACGV